MTRAPLWDRVDHTTIEVDLPTRRVRVTDWRYDRNHGPDYATLDSYDARLCVEEGDPVEPVDLTRDEEDAVDLAIRAHVEKENR